MTTPLAPDAPADALAPEVEAASAEPGTDADFRVRLDVFEGPFDLLLQLISKHKLDVTEVALSQVTDDFIAHVRAMGAQWSLDQTSSFLVIAATLLDLKAARLLPSGEVEDAEDLAALEARDLLFARLLQYRAFKQVSAWMGERMDAESRICPHPGRVEPQFKGLLPEVVIPGGVQGLLRAAIRAFTAQESVAMPLEQLHLPQVSVAAQAEIVAGRLRRSRSLSFRDLVAGATRLETVARFLALLELFRSAQVSFEQLTPLGELTVRWTGSEAGEVQISDEFDAPATSEDEQGSEASAEQGAQQGPERTGQSAEQDAQRNAEQTAEQSGEPSDQAIEAVGEGAEDADEGQGGSHE